MKTFTIKAIIQLGRSAPAEVQMTLTVESDRAITEALCDNVVKAFYPHHAIKKVAFSVHG
jgi:hypothetical protein